MKWLVFLVLISACGHQQDATALSDPGCLSPNVLQNNADISDYAVCNKSKGEINVELGTPVSASICSNGTSIFIYPSVTVTFIPGSDALCTTSTRTLP